MIFSPYVSNMFFVIRCLQSCVVKTLTLDVVQVCQPNSGIPALLMDTIDLYHFTPLLVALILSEGHKVSENKSCSVHSATQIIIMKYDVVLK